MEPEFLFQITPPDPERFLPQLSLALEKREELFSRQKMPKLWALTDRLNSVKKVPEEVRKKRRRRETWLSLLNWGLAMFLLIPSMTALKELLVPALVGAVVFGVSIPVLWRNKRALLGVLSLIAGLVLCFGALGAPEELGKLLYLGIVNVVIGIAALVRRKKQESRFEKQARKLLEPAPSTDQQEVRVLFSPEGMAIQWKEESVPFSYDKFTMVLETEDLLLPVCEDTMMVLQKKNLLTGTVPELRTFLQEQVAHYETL